MKDPFFAAWWGGSSAPLALPPSHFSVWTRNTGEDILLQGCMSGGTRGSSAECLGDSVHGGTGSTQTPWLCPQDVSSGCAHLHANSKFQ